MGHRANFVVIENQIPKAYFEPWGGLGCIYIFGDGPTAATEVLEEMEKTDKLLDWAFAEGGYLIDFDSKVAICFGSTIPAEDLMNSDGEYVGGDPTEFNEAYDRGRIELLRSIAPNWSGWTIRYDERGVDAFAEYMMENGILGIKTHPSSHPEDIETPSELSVP